MKIAIFAAVALLAGCVTSSEVVPMGKDSFMIAGSGRGGLGIGKSAVEATKSANTYCAKTQKFMVVRRIETQPNFNAESTTLIFSCVTADDPEYKRPDLRRDPTTIIEDQRKH